MTHALTQVNAFAAASWPRTLCRLFIASNGIISDMHIHTHMHIQSHAFPLPGEALNYDFIQSDTFLLPGKAIISTLSELLGNEFINEWKNAWVWLFGWLKKSMEIVLDQAKGNSTIVTNR
jgi:hypothetical protein